MVSHLYGSIGYGLGKLRDFRRDASGSYLVMMALLTPVMIGSVGLGIDYGMWVYTQQTMQAAADSAAVSAATAGSHVATEAEGVAASYGFVNNAGGVTMTVNQPPKSGSHTTSSSAVEVVINSVQTPQFSAVLGTKSFTITVRAVAVATPGSGCVLALNPTASGAVTSQGSSSTNLSGCNLYTDSSDSAAVTVGGTASITAQAVGSVGGVSGASNITTTNGIHTGVAPAVDPYASMSFGTYSGCDAKNYSTNSDATISAGVYCGGISVKAGATLTLNPGIYYLDGGNLSVEGNGTIKGTGVTLVFTSSTGKNYATASIASNATVNLTAPTTGSTAGIVLFGDRNMPQGTVFKLTGGGTQTFGGAIYLPKAALTYSGGSSGSTSCTQIIADTVTFTGNSGMAINCSSYATKSFGWSTAQLVE
jgi:Flp pilus assembly protein TadG